MDVPDLPVFAPGGVLPEDRIELCRFRLGDLRPVAPRDPEHHHPRRGCDRPRAAAGIARARARDADRARADAAVRAARSRPGSGEARSLVEAMDGERDIFPPIWLKDFTPPFLRRDCSTFTARRRLRATSPTLKLGNSPGWTRSLSASRFPTSNSIFSTNSWSRFRLASPAPFTSAGIASRRDTGAGRI